MSYPLPWYGHLLSSVSLVTIKATSMRQSGKCSDPDFEVERNVCEIHTSTTSQVCINAQQPGCCSSFFPRNWGLKLRKAQSEPGSEVLSQTWIENKRQWELLLGEKLNNEVKCYIWAVWKRGEVITTTITMEAATALVRSDRSFLSEIGGFISITPNLAKFLLYRLNFVNRNGNSTMKMTVENFKAAKQQFLDIKAVMEMEDILPELVFSW